MPTTKLFCLRQTFFFFLFWSFVCLLLFFVYALIEFIDTSWFYSYNTHKSFKWTCFDYRLFNEHGSLCGSYGENLTFPARPNQDDSTVHSPSGRAGRLHVIAQTRLSSLSPSPGHHVSLFLKDELKVSGNVTMRGLTEQKSTHWGTQTTEMYPLTLPEAVSAWFLARSLSSMRLASFLLQPPDLSLCVWRRGGQALVFLQGLKPVRLGIYFMI